MTGARIPSSPLSSDHTSKDPERLLPIANVSRIMKKSLPANAKISKEAKETVQECVSEFISFVTGEASDKCQREKRKTINGDDLLWAMTTLGFENYVVPLKDYLCKYREIEGEKISISRHDDGSPSPSPSNVDAEKIAANPSFLQGFTSGNYHGDHGGVVIGFGKFDGNGERPMAATSLHHIHGVEW
ncbi:nuclear factor Y [Perilla frutescens var. hirtella]|uniref:Nuclear factor Y n=1 Tax=Perilla frutescens var. hirtella TaxID=608512 RepID=A0AAD4JJW9_PERFH|nr:nuclear factor Y [Perilla frutescens var. hirtella]